MWRENILNCLLISHCIKILNGLVCGSSQLSIIVLNKIYLFWAVWNVFANMYQILQKFFKMGSIKLQVHVCMFNLFTVGKSSSLRALSVHQKMRSLASIYCYFTLKPAQYMNTGKNVNHSLHWYTLPINKGDDLHYQLSNYNVVI